MVLLVWPQIARYTLGTRWPLEGPERNTAIIPTITSITNTTATPNTSITNITAIITLTTPLSTIIPSPPLPLHLSSAPPPPPEKQQELLLLLALLLLLQLLLLLLVPPLLSYSQRTQPLLLFFLGNLSNIRQTSHFTDFFASNLRIFLSCKRKEFKKKQQSQNKERCERKGGHIYMAKGRISWIMYISNFLLQECFLALFKTLFSVSTRQRYVTSGWGVLSCSSQGNPLPRSTNCILLWLLFFHLGIVTEYVNEAYILWEAKPVGTEIAFVG